MNPKEGIIKFHLEFSQASPLPMESLKEINAWRKILYLTQLIGQNTGRYGGFGYGNISQRLLSFDLSENQSSFIISGSQTGDLPDLNENHYAVITACYPDKNRVIAEGPLHPSSESLTHGIVYQIEPSMQCVIHAHSPEIWQQAQRLKIPCTLKSVEYGTPEMAYEIERLFRETNAKDLGIFVMGGHEDGVVSFGNSVEAAGFVLLHYLSLAFQY